MSTSSRKSIRKAAKKRRTAGRGGTMRCVMRLLCRLCLNALPVAQTYEGSNAFGHGFVKDRNFTRILQAQSRCSGEVVQQCPGLLEISRGKPFDEPAIDRCQKLAGFSALPLLLPEATQAQGSAEFWHLRVLPARQGQGVLKTAFCLLEVRTRVQQQQLTLDPIASRDITTFLGIRGQRCS